jgi:small subunit ribosomal protein S20
VANHKSAAKRARQTITRNERNRAYTSKVRTAVKKLYAGIDGLKAGSTKQEEVAELFKTAQSLLMKAKTKGMTHRNTASRKISRLNTAVKKALGK